MDASNKHCIIDKKNVVFNNIFARPAAFIQGRRLFKEGIYSSNYSIYLHLQVVVSKYRFTERSEKGALSPQHNYYFGNMSSPT